MTWSASRRVRSIYEFREADWKEVFIPGFAFSLYTTAPDQEWVLKYQKNSMVVGSSQYNKIRRACRDAGVWAAVGFSERAGSTLYLACSIINPQGEVVLHRRKLKPTHAERYLWGDGQGEPSSDTRQRGTS